jgi:hypothetical protein
MATTLNAIVTASITTTFRNILDLSTPVDTLSEIKKIELANGTSANQADLCFHDQRTVAASGTDAIDLAGSLAGPFGAAQVFVELRAVFVFAAAANTNNVRVNRPASNGVPLFLAASDGIDVPPGGLFMWACPADGKVTVTAATGDLLNIDNSGAGTSVTYDVVILGCSA